MPTRTAPFDTVRKIGLAFPGVAESTTFGQPALKIGGETFACMASNKSAEPGTLMVRTDFERRDELVAEAPEIYYVTDHYLGYPSVLVRLAKIDDEALRGLLAGAMQFVAKKKGRTGGRRG